MLLNTTISNLFLSTVFFAGILSFFSPCILPVLPVYLGSLVGNLDNKKGLNIGKITLYWFPVLKTLAFISGLSFVFIILGYGASRLSSLIYTPYTNLILGFIVILLGIHQMELVNFTFLQREKRFTSKKEVSSLYEAFILGLTFSFGWTPCIGPVLSAILAVAASGEGSPFYGALLMSIYAFGLSLPFILLALMSSLLLEKIAKIKTHVGLIKRLGGTLIIFMGILLMSGQLNTISQLFT